MQKACLISFILMIITIDASAGTGYDNCLREEKALRSRESGACSGMSYLFNPSGCFATQKDLKDYDKGKCRAIGLSEHVVFGKDGVKDVPVTMTLMPATNLTPRQQTEIEALRLEVTRLNAEIIRLKAKCKEN